MNNTANKSERILKGVAIGLLCLFLFLGGFLLVKMGQSRDSMEQPEYTLGTNVPPPGDTSGS